MDIGEFFQLSSGKWFSHRTSHQLTTKDSEGSKSTLQIETLPNTDAEVVKLCQDYQVDPQQAVCGVRISWSGTVEGNPSQQTGTSFLVPVADPNNPAKGRILRPQKAGASAESHYCLGNDDVLTLVTEEGAVSSEERIWFASPNLRLRTGIVKQVNDWNAASFCSEIRMGVTQPAS
jgi:hypothetical protein